MEDLIRDRLPHAPQMGLFVAPDLPAQRLERALSDYAPQLDRSDVVALYDATLTGTGGDGAVFTADRVVFQNNDFQAVQTVRYRDLVRVKEKSRWFGLGGKLVSLTVNRGRATFELQMDFSGAPNAASYVADMLDAALVQDVDFTADRGAGGDGADETEIRAVEEALDRLRADGQLSTQDYDRLMRALHRDDRST